MVQAAELRATMLDLCPPEHHPVLVARSQGPAVADVAAVHAVDDRELAPGPVTSRAAKVFAACASEDLDP